MSDNIWPKDDLGLVEGRIRHGGGAPDPGIGNGCAPALLLAPFLFSSPPRKRAEAGVQGSRVCPPVRARGKFWLEQGATKEAQVALDTRLRGYDGEVGG
jgi:hypothetical protein